MCALGNFVISAQPMFFASDIAKEGMALVCKPNIPLVGWTASSTWSSREEPPVGSTNPPPSQSVVLPTGGAQQREDSPSARSHRIPNATSRGSVFRYISVVRATLLTPLGCDRMYRSRKVVSFLGGVNRPFEEDETTTNDTTAWAARPRSIGRIRRRSP